MRIAAAQPYEVTASDVQSQVAKLPSSGADTCSRCSRRRSSRSRRTSTRTSSAGSRSCRQQRGRRPPRTSCSSPPRAGTNKVVEGSVSIVFLKDPTDPRWKNDAAMRLYRQIMKRYAPGANVNDVYHVYGMAAAWTAVEALRKAGKDLTRDGLVKVVSNMNLTGNPFLLPGIAAQDRPGRPFPDRADGAPALAQGQLEELRRDLGLPHRVASSPRCGRSRPTCAGPLDGPDPAAGRLHMLSAPVRGDRPATTHPPMAHLVSDSSRRRWTTSWPRPAWCGRGAPGRSSRIRPRSSSR